MKVLSLAKVVAILFCILFSVSLEFVQAQTNWSEMLKYYESNKTETDLLLLDNIQFSNSEINFFFCNSHTIKRPKEKAILNIILGNIYNNFGAPDSAISLYNKVISNIDPKNSSNKLKRLYTIALINKSKASFLVKDSLQAFRLLEKSIKISKEYDFNYILARANYYLALSISSISQKEALEHINESINFYDSQKLTIEATNCKLTKFKLLSNTQNSQLVLNELINLSKTNNISQHQNIQILLSYGDLYYSINKDSLAISYYKKSLDLSLKMKEYSSAYTSANQLFLLYQKKKLYKKAFLYQKKNTEIKDTLKKISSNKRIFLAKNQQKFLNKETTVSELELKEIDNKIKIKQHQNNRKMLYLVFVFFLVLLLIIIYFVVLTRNFNKKLLKNNTELKSSNNELKIIQQKLEEQSKNKDRFFSIIAHDLRSPFNSVLGLSEYLSESINELEKEDIIHFNELIYTSSKSLYNLLENLLDWSKSQIGKLEYSPQLLDVYEVAERELEVLRILAKNKEIDLISNIQKGNFAYFDKEMISTVIRNITNNAIKFTQKKGTVSLDIKANSSELKLFIKDSGVGIPEKNMSKLFDAENYYTSYGTEGEKGTGLGLAICKEFINTNKGSISVKSTKNVGTEFKVCIPRTKEEAEL